MGEAAAPGAPGAPAAVAPAARRNGPAPIVASRRAHARAASGALVLALLGCATACTRDAAATQSTEGRGAIRAVPDDPGGAAHARVGAAGARAPDTASIPRRADRPPAGDGADTGIVHVTPEPGLRAGYARMRDTLARHTPVPVLVPRHFLGRPADDSLFVLVQGADSVSYDLIFSPHADCEGETVCRFGSVSGRVAPRPAVALGGRSVRLTGGRTAYYTPSVCAAGCTDATLAWTAGRYVYAVGLKRGRIAELRPIAESMVPLP